MKVGVLHPWNVTPQEARHIQEELAAQVVLADAFALDDVRLVAGVDNSYVKEGNVTTAYAAAVVLTFPDLKVIGTAVASQPVAFPYVPGLLSFREAPAVIAACAQIEAEPDVFLFDGQGYAHPRRLGLASHLGLLLDRPAIGCAKSRLVGRFDEPPRDFGAFTPLLDGRKVIGAAVRTRPGRAPLFVSPGHKVSVETAVALTLGCCRDNAFMPVPTQAAHDLVTEAARPHRERAKADTGHQGH